MSNQRALQYAIAKQARRINNIETDYGAIDVIALLSPERRTVLENTLLTLLQEELDNTPEAA